MKICSKTKMFSLLVFGILLIVLSLFVAYKLGSNIFRGSKEVFKFNEVRVLTNSIIVKLEENYNSVGKNSQFDNSIILELKKIRSTLKVIDTHSVVVFDSENNNPHAKKEKADFKTLVHFDASFETNNPEMVRYAFPIVVNDTHIANAIFTMPKQLLVKDNIENKTLIVLIPVIVVFLLIIVAALIFVFKFSKGILDPLEVLNKSARQIAIGNLELNIRYNKDSELGAFTRAFDMMREELKESLQRQAEYEKARKELIASISHDLKTPVASIKAYVEGLQDGIAKDKATTDRYLAVIKNKTDSLTKLIEDLFQHSLKDLGKFGMYMEEQYSGKTFRRIVDNLKAEFENSRIRFFAEEPIPDVLVNMDSSRIEQVIGNLVQNARKYTPEGGNIRLGIVLEEDCLKVSVKDTGYGVSPEELPYIFEKFYRGEKFKTRDFEGSGLGLSICKYIVEQHGGQISVESRLNEGSTFAFTLPKI